MTPASPYSLRLTQPQRDFIRAQASAMKMSDAKWIRYRLFRDTALKSSEQKILQPISHQKELAQILFLLGQSRIANNLNQIAKAVNMGTLVLGPDVYNQIDESYRSVIWMRRSLIKALGLKGD